MIDGVASVIVARHGSTGFPTDVANRVFCVLVKGSGEQKTAAAIFVDAGAPKDAVGVKPVILAGVEKAPFVGRLTFAVDGAEAALARVIGAFEGIWIRSFDDDGGGGRGRGRGRSESRQVGEGFGPEESVDVIAFQRLTSWNNVRLFGCEIVLLYSELGASASTRSFGGRGGAVGGGVLPAAAAAAAAAQHLLSVKPRELFLDLKAENSHDVDALFLVELARRTSSEIGHESDDAKNVLDEFWRRVGERCGKGGG